MMYEDRIKYINILDKENNQDSFEKCKVHINFHNGKSVTHVYETIEKLEIETEGIILADKIIKLIKLPSKNKLSKTKRIEFKNCIFISECDMNFYDFNSELHFQNCIFVKNMILFGNFSRTVSFTASTFLGEKSSFQECRFEHFVCNLVTLNNCKLDFQETSFNSYNIFFGNMNLNNSQVLFSNSFFPKNAELFDFLGVKSDTKSKILFIMVDFSFVEIRFSYSDIDRIEFLDCTFECNRCDLDFTCDTFIMQDCKNFRLLTLNRLKKLKNLNIYNFINTGKVIIDKKPEYYVNAINSDKAIIWEKANKYIVPEYRHKRNELFTLMGFFDLSQSDYVKLVQNEIKILEKIQSIKKRSQEPYGGIKIFLSYSWLDENLADDIDNKFAKHGITLIRDKRELSYKSSIREFMKQIREGDYVLILISDNYLKSVNCMYEVTEFIKDENYKDRILPILKEDAKIFKVIDRSKYIKYWQDEYHKLKLASNDIQEENKIDNIKEMIKLERIQRELSDFMSNISDMNLIICDKNITDEDFDKIEVLLFEDFL